MIVDCRVAGALDVPRDAVLVVGAGAAGLALALRLADDGQDVVLVESGGDVGDDAALAAGDDLDAGEVVGQPIGLVAGRSRVLGGTTLLWHGQCTRLHPLDVEPRSWVAGSGWPIGLADLERPYADAEEWLDVSGRGYGEQRWAEHPRLAPVPWDERHLRHDFTEYLRQPYLGRTHRARLDAHPRVTTLLGATVASVTVVDGRAVGVEVRRTGRAPEQLPARVVVLAAGTFENARLLQLSDPAGVGLGTGREHTGRYLQDHPIVRTAEVVSPDPSVLQDRYVVQRTAGRRLFPKVRLAPEAQVEHRLLDATAVFVHDAPDAVEATHRLLVAARRRRRPDDLAGDVRSALVGAPRVAAATWRRAVLRRSGGVTPKAVWLQVWVEQAPDPDRRVTLADSTDALGLRRSRVHWGTADLELETTRRLTRWVGHDLVRLGIGHLRELPAMTDDDAWRAGATDAAHPAGTTRMSTDPHDGVVDTDLRVHGVGGLYVVGGSVFPTSGYANPTLTIVALALRLAGHLRSGSGSRTAATSSVRASATAVGTDSAPAA